ncbi:TPA: GAF domain-containing protein [Candidatus Bathyarchaeota archaeon]|nr:GAF domain-containing protein [Candidatus Bathyarchaeota archaeon]
MGKCASLNKRAIGLAKARSVDSIYSTAIEAIESLVEFGWCGIGIVEGGYLRYRYYRGLTIPESWSVPLDGRGVTVRTVKTAETQYVPDVRRDPDYISPNPDDAVLSELAVPVVAGGEVRAVINVEGGGVDSITGEDRELVEALALHVGSALERLSEIEALEKSVAEKTQELLEASKMVAAGRVAATVAHDIKGPLQLIKNMVYLSKRRPERLGEFLDKIVDAVDYANDMIEGVKQATKEAPMVLTPTDLSKVIHEGATVVEGVADIVIDVNVEELGTQLVDGVKMRRVVENLVRNAVDAMPHGGTVKVTAQIQGDFIVVTVGDTGVGIPPEFLPRLFRAFESTKTQGMGLGLNFCRQTVEAHGGTIEASSEQGVGTTFTIRLPRRPDAG